MSKYNNVNPGQYKVGGRERPDTMAKARLKRIPTVNPPRPMQPKSPTPGRRSKPATR
jgi:hypothetical protein